MQIQDQSFERQREISKDIDIFIEDIKKSKNLKINKKYSNHKYLLKKVSYLLTKLNNRGVISTPYLLNLIMFGCN